MKTKYIFLYCLLFICNAVTYLPLLAGIPMESAASPRIGFL